MRIVFFTAFGPPHKGGVERYSVAFARRLDAAGHDVTIVTCNTEDAAGTEQLGGVVIRRLPCRVFASGQFPVPRTGAALRLLRRLRADPPDVVATYTRFYATSLLGFAASRLAHRPLYHLERGSMTYRGPGRVVNAASAVVDRTWGRLILGRAERVFAASEEVRRFVRDLGSREAQILGPRVDTAVFRPDPAARDDWRRRLGIRDDQLAVVYCGRLVATKGVWDLDAAFRELDDERAVVVYAGDGPERARLRTGPRVLCTGELDDAGVAGVLNAADVFVNPSHNEGLPNTVLEAGAVGVAVVATDAGGTREIVRGPDEGVVVAPGDVTALRDAIAGLLADPSRRASVAGALRRHVLGAYAWDDSAVAVFTGGGTVDPR
jgi:glycosyltransferase involved in cell wall biosynthesis